MSGVAWAAGDIVTVDRAQAKGITTDTAANLIALAKLAGQIRVPTSTSAPYTQDIPAFIKSDGATVEDFLTKTATQTGITNKGFTSPDITTMLRMLAQGEIRYMDADNSNYSGFKAASVVPANVIWTLPTADGTAKQVMTTNGSLGLLFSNPNMTLINADDTGGSATMDGTEKTLANYSLGANSYTKIFAIVTGHVSVAATASGGSVTLKLKIGATVKTYSFNYPSWASGHSGSTHFPFTMILSAVQTSAATIAITAQQSAPDTFSLQCHSLYVFGMNY